MQLHSHAFHVLHRILGGYDKPEQQSHAQLNAQKTRSQAGDAAEDTAVSTSGRQESGTKSCSRVPRVWSAFVDSFLDFAVGGQILRSEWEPAEGEDRNAGAVPTEDPPAELPEAERLVAIGDIHGDLTKAKHALMLAGVMDTSGHWIGGSTVLVQVGDLFDRGDNELHVLFLLEKLALEARRAGGAVHVLNGNHETINVEGWFRFVTPRGLKDFDRWAAWERAALRIKEAAGVAVKRVDPLSGVPPNIPPLERARFAALRPGGPITRRFLAPHPTALRVGSSLFVHGGLLPEHVAGGGGLAGINRQVQRWMAGDTQHRGPGIVQGANSVVWSRHFSHRRESECDCPLLEAALAAVPGARRMVVGHTIQQPRGVNSVCGGRVVRVDVGMSAGCYNAAAEVLEILRGRDVRVLTRDGPRPASGALDGARKGAEPAQKVARA